MLQAATQQELTHLPSILTFSKADAECWSLMPKMLERIGTFSEKYCPDVMSAVLVSSVMQDWVKINPGFLILGAIQDEELVGHLLAVVSITSWSQKRRCLILQYEIDREASVPRELLLQGVNEIIDWAKT